MIVLDMAIVFAAGMLAGVIAMLARDAYDDWAEARREGE